jgi:hypothetical protein
MTTLLNLPLAATSEDEPRYDLFDETGRVLLIGATHHAACLACDRLEMLPTWSSDFIIRRQHASQKRRGMLWDWRHEGPLQLLAYSSDVSSGAGVYVCSHVGRCGLDFEEAARRLDQFTEEHQAVLTAAMGEHFGFDPAERPTYLQGEIA